MNEEPLRPTAEAYSRASQAQKSMMPITYYISELRNQLEALRSGTNSDPLETQECLFHLLEALQTDRESLQSGHAPFPPAGKKEHTPAENDAQGMNNSPLEAEAELCLLELEAHAGLPFSTPVLRRRLPELMGQAQALLLRLPVTDDTLRHRLEAALALHLPAA